MRSHCPDGHPARIGDVVERLADAFALSPEDRSHLLPSGRQTIFANRVHWAKSYLGKAGLVELTRRAHFRITPRGREVLARLPEHIDIRFLTRFPEFQAFRVTGEGNGEATEVAAQAGGTTADLTLDVIMRAAAARPADDPPQRRLPR